jgi:hypothetical protein
MVEEREIMVELLEIIVAEQFPPLKSAQFLPNQNIIISLRDNWLQSFLRGCAKVSIYGIT